MAVLTESELRKMFKGTGNVKNGSLFCEAPEGTIVTPSARSFLTENHIQLRYLENTENTKQQSVSLVSKEDSQKPEAALKSQTGNESNQQPPGAMPSREMRYETVFGGFLAEKPEHMTHLYGNVLVFKDHPRILLRGKVDSLESQIMEVQLCCARENLDKLVKDLQDILLFVRQLMRSEVLNQPLGEFLLLGMTPADLREQSHYPQKYFGMGHFQPSYEMGEALIAINTLRTRTRETELAAYQAFKNSYGEVERADIIKAFNRLSSLFWIIMFRIRAGYYKTGGEPKWTNN